MFIRPLRDNYEASLTTAPPSSIVLNVCNHVRPNKTTLQRYPPSRNNTITLCSRWQTTHAIRAVSEYDNRLSIVTTKLCPVEMAHPAGADGTFSPTMILLAGTGSGARRVFLTGANVRISLGSPPSGYFGINPAALLPSSRTFSWE